MDPERWKKIKPILEEAVDVDPGRRSEFLARTCGVDGELAREIEGLLSFHDLASDPLEQSPHAGLPADVPDSLLGKQIGHYRIVEVIGKGGMGTVYLAERADGEFSQRVALKLIKRGMDSDAIIRRFVHERQILASLNHPNIARLLDGGTTSDGLPYLVIEYIEGQLLDVYCDAKQFSIEERLEIFRMVCSAVSYAHNQSVIHRDIKPANVLVTKDGIPKLVDFGIAKILYPESSEQTAEITETIFRAMTPKYASPEQIKGEPVTAASDIYSLGVMLYELLTGRSPYKIKNLRPDEMISIIGEAEPERPSSAITQLQEVDPTDDDVNKGATLEYVCRARDSEPEKLSRRLRGDLDNIVLMALRKEPERRYQSADELSDDIRRHLEGLPVDARKDTLGYRSSKFIRRHVVKNWRSTLVPIVLSVLIVTTGLGLSLYWMRIKVAGASISEKKSDLSRHETVVQQANEAYQKGRFLWNKRTPEDLNKAIDQFTLAISLEPGYAEAHAGIGDCYVVLAMGQPKEQRREMIEKGRAASLSAIEIDETLAEPHASLGFIAYDYDWNWEAAEKEYRRAIELNPNYPTAHHWFAYLLQNTGRNDEAIAEINRARELAPLSPAIARDVAEILANARRTDEAITQLRERIDLDENDTRSRDILSGLLWRKGLHEESIAETHRVIDRTSRTPDQLSNLAAKYLVVGRKADAEKLLAEAKQSGLQKFPLDYYVMFCNKDKIFEWIEEKYNNRDGIITNLKVHPFFDCIRPDPRYDDLVRRIGLL